MNTPSPTLADVLAAVAALDAKMERLLERLGAGAVAAASDEVSLEQLVPLMPPGLRSRSSVQRLLASKAISGRKVRGTWSFRPAKVLADLDHFQRLSVVEGVETRSAGRRGKR